jgi:acetyl esterase/lipase
MGIGMFLHRLAPPRPKKPNFYRTFNSTLSGRRGPITLYFYVPADWETQKKLWTDRPPIPEVAVDIDEEEPEPVGRRNSFRKSIGSIGEGLRRRSEKSRRFGNYPVVINFHGGGFTLGSPHDDARWCRTVVDNMNAVVVSVDYRLAPEHPFPTAVEDGVDAVIWIHNHAAEFGISTDKIILSGFSSGANMAFTVPLRLYDEQTGFAREDPDDQSSQNAEPERGAVQYKPYESTAASSTTVAIPAPDSTNTNSQPKQKFDDSPASTRTTHSTDTPTYSADTVVDPSDPPPPIPGQPRKATTTFHEQALQHSQISIRAIVPWYPSLDYTRTRSERRATCVRADQELPALFTNLFDDSYLHPPKDVSLDSPYLSPGVAPTSLLKNALPQDIIMHTCEWDMLLDEGQAFYERLKAPDVGKDVVYTMVEGVPHGWDKAPNPWKPTPGVREHYLKAVKEMQRVLGEGPSAKGKGRTGTGLGRSVSRS